MAAAANNELSDTESIVGQTGVAKHSFQVHLLEACSTGNLSQVSKLLQSESSTVDLSVCDDKGNTALHLAVQGGHDLIVKELCSKIGSSRIVRNVNGQTPLHISASKGQHYIVDILCTTFQHDVEAKDNRGHTPLHYAALWGHDNIVDILCRKFNCNSLAISTLERTLLHHACSGGHMSTVRKLVLEYNASVNDTDKDGNAPIHCAAFYGHSQIVFALVDDFKCSPSLKALGVNILFHYACAGGHVALAKEIIRKYNQNPHAIGSKGYTALHLAAASHSNICTDVLWDLGNFHDKTDYDSVHMIQVLINEYKLSPNVVANKTGETPLHIACGTGHVKAMKLLIMQFKCNPSSTITKNGRTPLHIAASFGRKEVVVELVSVFKCNVNCVDYSGASPLQLACCGGHIDVVEKLISYGANLNHTDNDGNSVMHSAVISNSTELVRNLHHKHNCSISSRDRHGITPLHLACQKSSKKVAQVLISEFNCDPNQTDFSGNTSLHHAAFGGADEVLGMLIKEFNCRADCTNRARKTPLHHACSAGNINIVQVLLNDFSANASCKDKDGNTPKDIANHKGYVAIVELFESPTRATVAAGVTTLATKPQSSVEQVNQRSEVVSHATPPTDSSHSTPIQNTALLDACKNGDIAKVRLLLANPNCSVQAKDTDGNSLLHLVAQFNYLDIAQAAISKVGDPGVNQIGQTPLHVASRYGSTEVALFVALKFPNNLRKEDHASCTPLFIACFFGHSEVVDLLLEKFHCSPNAPNSQNWTALGCACAGGHTKIAVKLITKYHCDPSSRLSGHIIPFSIAAFFGRTELVHTLIQEFGCSVDEKDNHGNNLLHLACTGGHASTVKLLIVDYGCDLFEPDADGNMALHFTSMCNQALYQKYVHGYAYEIFFDSNVNFAEVIRLLVKELKCPLDVRNCDGLTPLHIASIEGNLDLVKIFLNEFGCDPLSPDHNGNMPIHYAAREGRTELLRYLITEHKVSIDSVNFQLTTPLHLVCENGRLALCKILIEEFNANPDSKDGNGMTPVQLAMLKNHKDIVKLLSEKSHHVAPGSQGDSGTLSSGTIATVPSTEHDATMVRMACKLGDLSQVQNYFKQAGVDYLLQDDASNTLLHIASQCGNLHIVKELLSHYTNVQQDSNKNSNGRTPLHLACLFGHVSVVQYLSSFCLPGQSQPLFSNSAVDNSESTPVYLAALNGQTQIVNLLITEFNCSPNSTAGPNRTLLHAACDGGHIDLVNELILKHSADLHALDSRGCSPLHIACLAGRIQVTRALLTTFKCSVNVQEASDGTPLHLACASGHTAVVDMLISDFKADIDSRNNENNTPLNIAVLSGHSNVVDLLISKFECSPVVKGHRGSSLLHQACICGKPELIRNLVTKYGCDIVAVDDDGNSPLHQACGVEDEKLLALLIELGSPVEIRNISGDTPLHTAAMTGNTKIIRQLISDHGCSVDWRTNSGQSPLHSAGQKGWLEAVEVLLGEFKADPLAHDFDGNTVLHHAAYAGHVPVVKSLITNFKLDVNVVNFYVNTPLHLACLKGKFEVVKVLVQDFHADVSIKNNKALSSLEMATQAGYTFIASFLSKFASGENENDSKDDLGPGDESTAQSIALPLHHACIVGDLQRFQSLTSDDSCDIDLRDEEGNSPLHVAAQYGHVSIVEELLKKLPGPHRSCKNSKGRTPLHVAAYFGKTQVVQVLANKQSTNPDFASLFGLDITDNINDTALNLASLKGNIDIVKLLVSTYKCSPHIKGYEGRSILHQACDSGNIELVRLLISEYKLKTDQTDIKGLLPLQLASMSGKLSVVQELVRVHKCPLDAIELAGETAMHKAAREGCTDVMKFLHEAGASVVIKNFEGDTPLNTAALTGQLDSVRVFISELGCDPNVRGFNNRTPLLQACDGGHVDVVRLLISVFNCDITAKDDNGNTPVLIASVSGKAQVLEILVNEFKCPLDVVTNIGTGPLHVACLGGHTEVVEKLITKFKCDPTLADRNGMTPIHHAAISGNVSMVRKLISDFKCPPNAITVKGAHTPLHDACQNGQTEIARILISEFDCDPMEGDSGGNTAVHHAVFGGSLETLKMLTSEFKVDVNCVNFQLASPLHLACERGNLEATKVLIEELNADISQQDVTGRTPQQVAATGGHSQILAYFQRQSGGDHPPQSTTGAQVAGSTGPTSPPVVNVQRKQPNEECTAVGGTELHQASKADDIEAVQLFIQDPTHTNDIAKVDNDGNTALHIACYHGNTAIVEVLLQSIDTVSSGINNNKETSLHLACKTRSNKTIVQILASKFPGDLSQKDGYEDMPVHVACLYGQEETVEILCKDFKCDPNSKGCNGRTCLHHACSGGHANLVRKLILNFNCNPEATDIKGNTPLHCAAFYGHSDVFFLLISELNCPITLRGSEQSTVLHHACAGGHVDLMNTLITLYEFSCFEPNEKGFNALHFASEYAFLPSNSNGTSFDPLTRRGCFHSTADLSHTAVIRALVKDFNCSLDSQTLDGDTPVMCAMRSTCQEVINLFLEEFKCSKPAKKTPSMQFDSNGRTLLHLAASMDNVSLIEDLITQQDHDIFARDVQGATPLHSAALNGSINAARVLVTKFGCPIDIPSNEGHTPLHCAAQNDHLALIRVMVNELHGNTLSQDNTGSTPLHQAAVSGRPDACRVLVNEFKCPVDSVNFSLQTPLHVSCFQGLTHVVKVLVGELGANPMQLDAMGNTPLDIALKLGNGHLTEALTDISSRATTTFDSHSALGVTLGSDHSGLTNTPPVPHAHTRNALFQACRRGEVAEVEMLIQQNGHNPKEPDNEGFTPLHIAARSGHAVLVEKLVGTFQCDPFAVNNDGDTPLHVAVTSKKTAIVDMLITRFHSDPNSPGGKGRTPVHIASFNGDTEMVQKLIQEFHVDIMATDHDQNTPLHLAALYGKIEVVRMLSCEFKCDLSAVNKDSKTALNLSTERHHEECMEWLSRYPTPEGEMSADRLLLAKVLVLGDSGSGKSSLVETLTKSSIVSSTTSQSSRMNVVRVKSLGIVASFIELLNDTQSTAYVLRQFLISPGCVVILVVDISKSEDDIVKTLNQWLSLISYVATEEAMIRPNVLLVGSHNDLLQIQRLDGAQKLTECFTQVQTTLQDRLQSVNIAGCYPANVCTHCSQATQELTLAMLQLFQSLRQDENSRFTNSQTFNLLQILDTKFSQTIPTLSDVTRACAKFERLNQEDQVQATLEELQQNSLVYCAAECVVPCTTIMNIVGTLHRKIKLSNQTSPEASSLPSLSLHTRLSESGMITIEDFFKLVPQFPPRPIVQCLEELRFFQRVPNISHVLPAVCQGKGLHQPLQVASNTSVLFCPTLLRGVKSNSLWRRTKYTPFARGLLIQPVGEHSHFPSHFITSLIFEVATTCTFPSMNTSNYGCQCELADSSIHWVASSGLEALVIFLLPGKPLTNGGLMIALRGLDRDCDRLMSFLLTTVETMRVRMCRSLHIESSYIHPSDLLGRQIPLPSMLHLFSVTVLRDALQLMEGAQLEDSPVNLYNRLIHLTFWDVLFPIHVREIELYLEPVCGQWYDIGEKLGLSKNVLDGINGSHPPPTQALHTMVETWLESGSHNHSKACCWATLVDTLIVLSKQQVVHRISLNRESEITLQKQLLQVERLNSKVDDSFLESLAEFTRSISSFLASVLSLNIHDCSAIQAADNPGLLALQCWRERNVSTFGELLNVFTVPILQPSFYQSTCVRTTPAVQLQPLPAADKNIQSQLSKDYGNKLAGGFLHSVQDNPSHAIWTVHLSSCVHTASIEPKGKKVQFKELGIAFTFPRGAVPKDCTVKLSIAKKSEIPSSYTILPGMQVRSSVYFIAIQPNNVRLLKPVSIAVKLSTRLVSQEQCQSFAFVRGSGSERQLEVVDSERVVEFKVGSILGKVSLVLQSQMILAVVKFHHSKSRHRRQIADSS